MRNRRRQLAAVSIAINLIRGENTQEGGLGGSQCCPRLFIEDGVWCIGLLEFGLCDMLAYHLRD
jgi:hypothetical protein